MTLADAIKQAVRTRSTNEWRGILDCLRSKLGLDYTRSWNCVRKVLPNLTLADFDGICRSVDDDCPETVVRG